MKLLHLYAGNLFGGVERLLLTLARQQSRCAPTFDHQFGLCFDGKLAAELRRLGAPVHDLGAVRVSRPWTVWRARRRLADLLREHPPFDAVICHSNWPHAIFAPVIRGMAKPLIYAAHDVPDPNHWVDRWSRQTRPDLIIANSAFTAGQMQNLFPGVASAQVSPAVEKPVRLDEMAREGLRRSIGTSAGQVVILLAARMHWIKGHRVMVDALSRMTHDPTWTCWIAGAAQTADEQAYADELSAQVRGAGLQDRVHFLGHRDDVPQLMQAADIYCQPNVRPETFGISLVEALYAGTPVVTSSIGAAPEIIDNRCGILTRAEDASSVAAALQRLVAETSLRRTLGAAGPSRAAALCDPQAVIGALTAVVARTAMPQGVVA